MQEACYRPSASKGSAAGGGASGSGHAHTPAVCGAAPASRLGQLPDRRSAQRRHALALEGSSAAGGGRMLPAPGRTWGGTTASASQCLLVPLLLKYISLIGDLHFNFCGEHATM